VRKRGIATSNSVRAMGAPRELLHDERRELGDVVGPHDEIDVAHAPEERLALLLGTQPRRR